MRVIRSSEYRRMPWKNGGGETAEIAVSPAGAAFDAFDWRISMARVDGDGPFSAFAGIDRTLVVLDGAGMRLAVAGREPTTLNPASEPYAFPADCETSATLLGGPITDFNVMTRRRRVSQRVRREVLSAKAVSPADWTALLIFCINGRLTVRSATAAVAVGPRDSALFEQQDSSAQITADSDAAVLIVELAAERFRESDLPSEDERCVELPNRAARDQR